MTATNKPVLTSQTLAPGRSIDVDPTLLAKRRERIREFEAESLNKANPLQAVLGACASDLMKGMLYLREGLEHAWGQECEPVEQLSKLLPCLDQLGKVSKQLEALIELQLSLQDRRLLAKNIRLQGKANIRSKNKKELVVQHSVSPTDKRGPLQPEPVPKHPR